MTRAALYLRVSTKEQTIENQRPDMDRIVAARGLEVVAMFEEQASAVKKRPAYEAMMKDARRGAFKVLAIWGLDRFGRSMVGNMVDVLELDALGVQLVSAHEPWLDTTGPVRQLLIGIFSWIAEQERSRIVERTKAGLERARAQGKRIGRPAYRIDGNHLDMLLERRPYLGATTDKPMTMKSIARRLGVSERTLRKEMARRRSEHQPPILTAAQMVSAKEGSEAP